MKAFYCNVFWGFFRERKNSKNVFSLSLSLCSKIKEKSNLLNTIYSICYEKVYSSILSDICGTFRLKNKNNGFRSQMRFSYTYVQSSHFRSIGRTIDFLNNIFKDRATTTTTAKTTKYRID